MKPSPLLLIIDPDRANRRLLRLVLEPQRYKIFEAEDASHGIREAVNRRPDVIILDLSLPDIDGLDLLGNLREWNTVPILILTAESEEDRKVAALDAGANDYLLKPFGPAELLARLRVLQRFNACDADGPYYINGHLRVDVTSHATTVDGRLIVLTPTEEALFFILVRYAGKLVTWRHLVRAIWGTGSEGKIHDLHVYIRSLRRKLGGATSGLLIQTQGSEGYRLLLPHQVQGVSEEIIRSALTDEMA